jgi:adenylate kinase family enzyme
VLQIEGEGRTVRRIHIIGGPGSGKSTLARQLGPRLNLPVYNLDKIAFEGIEFRERPLDVRLADVRRIAEQPAWITEGIFVGWTDELLRAADLIVWLDHLNWRIASWRIVTRFFGWAIQESKRQPGMRKFTRFQDYSRNLRQLIDVLATSRQYYSDKEAGTHNTDITKSRAVTHQYLTPYRHKVVHCRSTHDIRLLVAGSCITDLQKV